MLVKGATGDKQTLDTPSSSYAESISQIVGITQIKTNEQALVEY